MHVCTCSSSLSHEVLQAACKISHLCYLHQLNVQSNTSPDCRCCTRTRIRSTRHWRTVPAGTAISEPGSTICTPGRLPALLAPTPSKPLQPNPRKVNTRTPSPASPSYMTLSPLSLSSATGPKASPSPQPNPRCPRPSTQQFRPSCSRLTTGCWAPAGVGARLRRAPVARARPRLEHAPATRPPLLLQPSQASFTSL